HLEVLQLFEVRFRHADDLDNDGLAALDGESDLRLLGRGPGGLQRDEEESPAECTAGLRGLEYCGYHGRSIVFRSRASPVLTSISACVSLSLSSCSTPFRSLMVS